MKTNADPTLPEHRVGIVEFLDRSLKPRKGLTIVELLVPSLLRESVESYLDSTGLEDSEGIGKIVQFGLGLNLEDEFASLTEEVLTLSDSLSEADKKLRSSKLDAYENLIENKAKAAELASLLSENRLLRHRLTQHHLQNSHQAREHEELVEKANLYLSKYTFRARL